MNRKKILILALAGFWISLSGAESIKGVLFPFREAQIASRVDSTLKSCKYRIGEKFAEGAVLIELDEKLFSLQVKRMQEQEKFAKALHADKKELRAGNFTSDFEVKKAEFEWKNAETQLEEALLRLSYCRIKAPFAGKIVEILIKEHESVRRGDALLKIIDDRKLLAVMNIPLQKIKPVGTMVKMKLENGSLITGKVYELSPLINHKTGTCRVRILVDNAKGRLWAGMTGVLCNEK